MSTKPKAKPREPLSKERIIRTAVDLADEAGLESCTMRKVAPVLGVVPMALYKHVSSKEEMLGGMLDVVFEEFHDPDGEGDWRSEMSRRATAARKALSRHPWAVGLIGMPTEAGPAMQRHQSAAMDCLRGAGFDRALAAHALSVQDAYIYGFALRAGRSDSTAEFKWGLDLILDGLDKRLRAP